jgi:hypothetical protein
MASIAVELSFVHGKGSATSCSVTSLDLLFAALCPPSILELNRSQQQGLASLIVMVLAGAAEMA